jgi:hypothetical protein
MRDKHRKDSMVTLSFFVVLILIFVFDRRYTAFALQILADPSKITTALADVWPAFIVTLVTPFVSYFLGIITIARRDLYYDIDDALVGRREDVDRFICERLIDFGNRVSAEDAQGLQSLRGRLHAKRRELLGLFYAYIEQASVVNPQLKTHAFTYWGDYFSSLMFAFWGILAVLVTTVIFSLDPSLSALRFVVWLAMAGTIGLNLHAVYKGKPAKKQFEIPTTQIAEIHRNARDRFLADLRKERFYSR